LVADTLIVTINTRAELHEHLRLAMYVELSTIPLYLFGLYSIDEPASDAALLLRSIVAEEMLHLALAANLLLAVGGEPAFLDHALRPTYPSLLPNHAPPLTLNLAPASEDHIRATYLAIEQPDPVGSPAEAGLYDSLGEFYAEIEASIERLTENPTGDAAGGLFANPQVDRQLSDPRFYGPIAFNAEASGDLMLVNDLASARAAIEVIVHQGEGLSDDHWADPGHQELTHYAKLLRILDGTSPVGHLRPLRQNPRAAEYPPSARSLSDLFNAVYAAVFVILDSLYSPTPRKGSLVTRLYTTMATLLPPIARRLTTLPLGDGTVAGPTFEPFDLGSDPSATLTALARRVASDHPDLSGALAPIIEHGLLPTSGGPAAPAST
jgi:hypothetical protein